MKNTHELDTFWSAIPRLPGSQMIRETLTVTELNRQSSSQDILFWIQSLHSYDVIKEHQGQVIARELKKIFSFNFMTLVSVRGKKQTILVLSKKCENVFSFRTNRNWNVYLVENSKWWGFSFFPLLSLNQPQGLVSCNFFSQRIQ